MTDPSLRDIGAELQALALSTRDVLLRLLQGTIDRNETAGTCFYAATLVTATFNRFYGYRATLRGGGQGDGGFLAPDGQLQDHYWTEVTLPRDKPPAFRPGKDSAAPVSQSFALAIWQAQIGVACCSMYWRTTEMGAPPHEAAK